MKRKIILAIGGVLVLIVIGLSSLYLYINSDYFSLSGPCGDTVFTTVEQKESKITAQGLVKNCGATTDFVTQILIDKMPVIILKSDYSKYCSLNWLQTNLLDVTCSGVKESDIFLATSTYKNIQVNFKR